MLLAAAVFWFGWQVDRGLWAQGFSDETTHLLGGWVIGSGGVLYRDFIDNHGPVIYMLTSLCGSAAGWSAPHEFRLVTALFMLLAAAAIMASPVLSGVTARLCAGALFLGLLAPVWIAQGLYLVSFYPVAGALAAIMIALLAAPVWFGRVVPAWSAFLAGLACGALFFTGYQYGASCACLALPALYRSWVQGHRRAAVALLVGVMLSSLGIIAWLGAFGDIVGYLAFHIAFGTFAFRPFVDLRLAHFLAALNPSSFAPAHVVQAVTVVGFFLSCGLACLSTARDRRVDIVRLAACLLGAAGIAALNIRGDTGFKNGSFVVAVLATIPLAVFAVLANRGRAVRAVLMPVSALAVGFAFAGATRQARPSPAIDSIHPPAAVVGRPQNDPVSQYIRSVLSPQEHFLALVYTPDLYFAAGRQPMPGYFAYFPWDAVYARSPWWNRPRDLCVSLAKDPPRIIVLDAADAAAVGARDYMPCVFEILAQRYVRNRDLPSVYTLAAPGHRP